MSEKALQQAVVDLAKLLHWETYHTFDSRHSAAGWPDLVLARLDEQQGRTRLIVVELKSERGVVTEAQQRWLDLFAGAGISAYTWRPSDWHSGEIERVLQERPA